MGKRQRKRDRLADGEPVWADEPVLMTLTLNGNTHELALRTKAEAEAFLLDLGSGLRVIDATFSGWKDLDIDVIARPGSS